MAQRVLLSPVAQARTALPFAAGAGFVAAAVGAVTTFNPFLAAALVFAIGLTLLVAWNVQALLLFLVLTVFVEDVSFGPGLRIGRVAAVVAFVVVAIYVLSRGRVVLRPNLLLVAATGFGGLMLLSVFWADHPSYVYVEMYPFALALCYTLAFAVLVREIEHVQAVFATLALGALGFGLLAFAGFPIEETAGDPNAFASFQVLALGPALALASVETRARRFLYVFAVMVIGVSVVASLSRGGLIALGVVVLVALAIPSGSLLRSGWEKLFYTGAVVAGGVLATLVLGSVLIDRVQTIVNSGGTGDRGSGRLDIWAAALRAWNENPVLGIGAGNFKAESFDLLRTTPGVDVERNYVEAGKHVHSLYLNLLAELGVVGFVWFSLVLVLTAWYFVRSARRASGLGDLRLRRLSVAALVGLVGIAAAGIFLSNQLSKPIWILIGLAIALDSITSGASKQSPLRAPPIVQPPPRKRPTDGADDKSVSPRVDELLRLEAGLRRSPASRRTAPRRGSGLRRGSERRRAWTLSELDELMARPGSQGSKAAHERRRSFLALVRRHADADGRLPPRFDGVVREHFADLSDRD